VVQVDPIKTTLKAPGTKRLELNYVQLLSYYAFKFNLRRCNLGKLHPVHRLDKNVSGLLLMARSPIAANTLRQQVRAEP